ncbi:hypothetical protein ACVXG9_11495 [Escherichia coli]
MNPERSERIESRIAAAQCGGLSAHGHPLICRGGKFIRCLEAAMDHDKKLCWSRRKKLQRMSRV